MSKNKKNRTASSEYVQQPRAPRYPVNIPDVMNIDALACLLDEALTERLQLLDQDRIKVVDAGFDPVLWEVEIAYVRRELQIRRERRDQHDRYLADLREQDRIFALEEANLPVADFDNFRLVEVYNNA